MAPILLGILAGGLIAFGAWPIGILFGVVALVLYKSRSSATTDPSSAEERSVDAGRLAALEERVAQLERLVAPPIAPVLEEPWWSRQTTPAAAAADAEATPEPPIVAAPSYWPPLARPAREASATLVAAAAPLAMAGPEAGVDAAPATPIAERAPAGPSILERAGRAILGAIGPTGTSAEAIESWLSGRLLAVVGGIALLLGAIFFLSLAFSRGWISEPLRVVIGLLAGSGLVGLAAWLFGRRFQILGNVLMAVGLAVVSLALYAAAPLYDLIAVEFALVGALAAAVVAAGIAIRFESQLVAGMGLVAVLGAPPVLGASPNLATVAFLAVALVGTTTVALFRTWRWLPPIAFVLSAPQLASYVLGDVAALPAVTVVLAYWALYALAAGGEEWRVRRTSIAPTSVTLLLAATVLAIWAGFAILDGDLDVWRGPFLVALAAGHAVVAGLFLRREGDRHPFGLIAAGTGVAAFSMAVPVHFGGPPVPIAWAAEAVALAWVASIRRHEYSALVSAILGTLAIGHLIFIEYPLGRIASAGEPDLPFIGPDGATLAFILAALAVSGVFLKPRSARTALAALGSVLVVYAAPFELTGVALVAAWSAIFAICVLAERFVVVPERADASSTNEPSGLPPMSWLTDLWESRPAGIGPVAIRSLMLPAVVALALAVGHVMAQEYRLRLDMEGWVHQTPFYGPETLALVAVLAALTVVGAAWRDRRVHSILLAVGALLLVYVMPAELAGVALVAGWLAVGLLAFGATQLWLRTSIRGLGSRSWGQVAEGLPLVAAALAAVVAVGHVLIVELTPRGFFVGLDAATVPTGTPFIGLETLTAVILVAAVAAAWAVNRYPGAIPFALVAIGGIVAYLLPFELASWLAVVGWAALALLGLVLAERWGTLRVPLGAGAVTLLGCGAAVLLASLAPPDRLVVDAAATSPHLILVSPASGAAAALIVALVLGAWIHRTATLVRPTLVAAGIIGIYALSVGLVDEFQGRVGGSVGLEELQKQASVGLTVLWAVCGGVAFGIGQLRRILLARYAGLVLLGLATAKAFVVDLAGLDVAYRVLSFVGLGILLLASAYVAARMRPKGGSPGPKSA